MCGEMIDMYLGTGRCLAALPAGGRGVAAAGDRQEAAVLGPGPGAVPATHVRTCTVQYSTVQYSTVQYSTVQYSTVQYITVQ